MKKQTPKSIPAGAWLLGSVSFLNDSASEAIYPLLPTFLATTLGVGPATLGILEGTAEALTSILKWFSGYWSDRFSNRSWFVFVGYAFAVFARPLLGWATSIQQVFAIRLFDRFGKGLRSAPRDAWLADMTPQGSRGRVYGLHRAMDHAGSVMGPILATVYLFYFPRDLRGLFHWSILPGLLALLLVGILAVKVKSKPEVAPARPEKSLAIRDFIKFSKDEKLLLSAFGIFALGNASDAFILLKISQLGMPIEGLPAFWALLHFIKSSASAYFGKFTDRLGPKPLIISGWIVLILTSVGLGFAENLTQGIVCAFVGGLFPALTEGPEKTWLSQIAQAHERGSKFGAFYLVLGVMQLPASIWFGYLWEKHGSPVAFLTSAAICTIASMMLIFVRNRKVTL